MTNSLSIQNIIHPLEAGFQSLQMEHLFIVFGSIGIINMLFPRMFWFFKEGWKIKGKSEPSLLWLFNARLGGLVLALICFWWVYHLRDPVKAIELEHKALKYGYDLQTNITDKVKSYSEGMGK